MSASLGVYVHVPFCARACPYCDFDFEVGRRGDLPAYLEGVERELAHRRTDLAGRNVTTLYIGGGTPSLLTPSQVGRIRDAVGQTGQLALEEWTVEANPEHVDRAWAEGIRSLGVDRVSLGTQSFAATGLTTLGRAHDAAQARQAARILKDEGLRVSVDLIVGWPGQGAAGLERELEEVVRIEVEHISVYALTIEDGTPWTTLVRRGVRAMPDDDAQADRLAQTERFLLAAGYEHYEIASYARAGARAVHNVGYWRWRDYVGIGPSAASATFGPDGTVARRTNPRGLDSWRQGLASPADPGAGALPTHDHLGPDQAAREGLWLGLRLLEPLDLERFERHFSRERGWAWTQLEPLARRGLIRRVGQSHAQVEPGEWLLHDIIADELLPGSPAP